MTEELSGPPLKSSMERLQSTLERLGSRVHGSSATCSPKFPDPREFAISVERPFSVKNSAEMRRFSVGKSSATETGHGIPSLQRT